MKLAIFFALTSLMAAISLVQCEECDNNKVCGECPSVPTVANLDKKKFSGIWYSIQDSSPPRIPCMHYDVQSIEDGFSIKFLPYNFNAKLVLINFDDISQGFRSEIEFEKINGGNFSVFDTDYKNYAGVFTCKKTNSDFQYSVTFWSRTRKLDCEDVNTMKTVLTRYNVDFTGLEDIFQSKNDCVATGPVVSTAAKTLLPLLGR